MAKKRWAISLSGGGVMGAAHLGFMRALAENPDLINPDIVVGTSAGGIVAGALASGVPLEGLISFFREVCAHPYIFLTQSWLEEVARPFMEFRQPHALFDLGDMLVRLMSHATRLQTSGWPDGYAVIATDLMNNAVVGLGNEQTMAKMLSGKYRGLRSDSAIQATSAFPALFRGVSADGYYLVDGGLLENTPISAASLLGAEVIVNVRLSPSSLLFPSPRGMVDVLEHAFQLAVFNAQKNTVNGATVVDVPLTPPGMNGLLDFGSYDLLVEYGYNMRSVYMPKILSAINST